MSIVLIPGKKIAQQKRELLREAISAEQGTRKPSLRIVQVGDDSASTLYVGLKIQEAQAVGMDAAAIVYAADSDKRQIVEDIHALNKDSAVDGIIVQAPIPNRSLDESLEIFNAIAPDKDVDGLSFTSLGKLWQLKNFSQLGSSGIFLSATPLGVLDILLFVQKKLTGEPLNDLFRTDYSRFESLNQLLSGKNALIINRSNIVGKPLAALLEMANATVTIAHSHTINLEELAGKYDIVLPATGIEGLFTTSAFGQGQIAIDIGINNSDPDSPVTGDISLIGAQDITKLDLTAEPLARSASDTTLLSAVPGGVGPLTVTNLLYNTYMGYSRRRMI